jgi:hypothetical protein
MGFLKNIKNTFVEVIKALIVQIILSVLLLSGITTWIASLSPIKTKLIKISEFKEFFLAALALM